MGFWGQRGLRGGVASRMQRKQGIEEEREVKVTSHVAARKLIEMGQLKL